MCPVVRTNNSQSSVSVLSVSSEYFFTNTMFECKKCGKFFVGRSQMLVHSVNCPDLATETPEDIDEEAETTADDTDADPNWSPTLLRDTTIPSSMESSPITDEQIKEAAIVQEIIFCGDDNETQHQEKEETLKYDDLHDLKKKIEDCKNERKLASRSGKRSKIRRLSKQITKLQMLVKSSPGSSSNSVNDEEISSEEMDIEEMCEKNLSFGEKDNDEVSPDETTDMKKCVKRRLFGGDDEKKLKDDKKRGQHQEKGVKLTSHGRKQNYCLYCSKFVKKFGEHLQNKHADKPEGKSLLLITSTSSSSAEMRIKKTKLTDPIRKKWNSIYNKTKSTGDIVIVKRRKENSGVGSVECSHCHGVYRRDKLSVHLRRCTNFEKINSEVQVQAIKKHSVVPVKTKFVSEEFEKEILNGIVMDTIIETATEDELIMKFVNDFHHSRREQSSKNYVIREMRDLTRLLIEVKTLNPEIHDLKNCINPKYFDLIVNAALNLAGYEQSTGEIKTHSIAYRLSQPLKDSARIFLKEETKKYYEEGAAGSRQLITQIEDFITGIENHWKNRIGRLCTKSKKIARADRSDKVALERDIMTLAAYLESQYRMLMAKLEESDTKNNIFDRLTHVLVSHIMLLVRRRPVDFKNARVKHFGNVDKHDELLDMVANAGLSEEELKACKRFHIFYVPGKNLEIVPIVMLPIMKQALEMLLANRGNVGITNDILFTLSENKFINPVESLRIIKRNVPLKKPEHLTGNGLRHQAATFSRMHSNHPQYQDYLASTLGHTLSVHKKHYDLPLGVIQKIMVCPILEKIMRGKKTGEENQRSSHEPSTSTISHEIIDNTTESDIGHIDTKDYSDELTLSPLMNSLVSKDNIDSIESFKNKKRWTKLEQEIVISHFGQQILRKEIPRRGEIVSFLKENSNIDRTVAQVMLFVRNHCVRKQKNVTPKVKNILNKK